MTSFQKSGQIYLGFLLTLFKKKILKKKVTKRLDQGLYNTRTSI